MMNTFKLFSAAAMLTLTALTSGCTSDDEVLKDNTDKGSGTPQQTITVGTESTRVAYDDETLKLTWQDDDKLVVIGYNHELNSSESAEYVLSDGAGSQKGSFTGNKIDGATEYHVYYPAASIKLDKYCAPSFILGEQIQNGNGSTDHLRNNIFFESVSLEDLSNITLIMGSSIMKFDLSNVPSEVGTLKKLIWTVETKYGFNGLELAFPTSGDKMVTFSGSNNTLTAYLAFFPHEINVKKGGKFSVTLIGDKVYKAETTVTNGKDYVAGNRYTATINGSNINWKESELFTIQTTLPKGVNYNYNGLECQIGTWDGSTQTTLGSAIIVGGKAYIDVNLSSYADKDIWVCIPKVAKFFHTLTSEEANSNLLTLPDKDKGSTLKDFPTKNKKKYENDWIVALYMGINKDGSTSPDATPLYWATGNLIATKTNAKDSGTTTAVFHVATNEEVRKQSSSRTTTCRVTPEIHETDGYSGCASGSQWNFFGWGDATGLMTTSDNSKYAPDVTQEGASICGDSKYDIARAQLGKNWRLPSGGKSINSELASLRNFGLDERKKDLYYKGTYIGCEYTYIRHFVYGWSKNTLFLPAAGYRNGKDKVSIGTNCYFLSGTLANDKNDKVYYYFIKKLEDKIDKGFRHFGRVIFPVSE